MRVYLISFIKYSIYIYIYIIIILKNVNDDHIVYGIQLNKITNSFMSLFDTHTFIKKSKQNSYKEKIYFSSFPPPKKKNKLFLRF